MSYFNTHTRSNDSNNSADPANQDDADDDIDPVIKYADEDDDLLPEKLVCGYVFYVGGRYGNKIHGSFDQITTAFSRRYCERSESMAADK